MLGLGKRYRSKSLCVGPCCLRSLSALHNAHGLKHSIKESCRANTRPESRVASKMWTRALGVTSWAQPYGPPSSMAAHRIAALFTSIEIIFAESRCFHDHLSYARPSLSPGRCIARSFAIHSNSASPAMSPLSSWAPWTTLSTERDWL